MTDASGSTLIGYWQRIRLFQPSAKRYIIANTILGFAYGISNTIYNLFLLSLGYSNTFLGGILSISFVSVAVSALFFGPLFSRVGATWSTILGVLVLMVSALWRVLMPIPEVIILGEAVGGVGISLTWVAFSPFLSEHSSAFERTHLFGTTQSLNIISMFIGNTVAGVLPVWFALALTLPIDSAPTFQLALFAWIIPLVVAIAPLLFIRKQNYILNQKNSQPNSTTTEKDPKGNLGIVIGFAIVYVFLGLGAGFIVPFLNVFFWGFYNLPTPFVGLIQGLGSASVALGLFLAPILSSRIGKVRAIIVIQTLSLPFLVTLAVFVNPFIASASYILRQVFMQAAMPIDDALRMELVPRSWRTPTSAVITAVFNATIAFSVQITGQLYDLGLYLLPFWFTLICYTVGTVLYTFFIKPEKSLSFE
ncbi:MAG: MFS transporter [Candidatus Hermodarchaeota archaeon]|nr:MFS transporter [Candidatus Hermodarchaeota archaeon]